MLAEAPVTQLSVALRPYISNFISKVIIIIFIIIIIIIIIIYYYYYYYYYYIKQHA